MNIDTRIFLPALAMVAPDHRRVACLLPRVAEMRRERIHPQAVALSAQMAERPGDTRAADNFRNLFELPVLFLSGLVVAALSAVVRAAVLGLKLGPSCSCACCCTRSTAATTG